MIDRYNRAAQTLDNTLELTSEAGSHPKLTDIADRISGIIKATDFIGLSPYDETLSPDAPVTHLASFRHGSDILPPTAYMFQAMPEDVECFPEELYSIDGVQFYPVVHKILANAVYGNIVDNHDFTDEAGKPLVMMAHFEHPLTQAIAGLDVFSKLHGSIYDGYPLSGDIDDPDTAVYLGLHSINAGRVVTVALGTSDKSGNTQEWLDDNITRYTDLLQGRSNSFKQSIPPDGTEIAEAYRYDPATEGIVSRYIVSEGVLQLSRENGYTLGQAAFGVHEKLEKSHYNIYNHVHIDISLTYGV